MKKVLTFTFIFICAFAWAAKVPETKNPINVSKKGFPKIAAHKIESGITPGAVIGEVLDGALKVRQNWLNSGGDYLDAKSSEAYANIVNEELNLAGYSTSVTTGLFADVTEDLPRFQIGGTITKANIKIFMPLAGNAIRAILTVKWEVFDTFQKKVIYTKETEGYAYNKNVNDQGVFNCFRNTFKNLAVARFAGQVFVIYK